MNRFKLGCQLSAVSCRLTLILFLPGLQGCSLLFVQKGETHHLANPVEIAPHAASQSRALSATPVIEYKVKEGDTLELVSLWYFGNTAKAGKIAKDNQILPAKKLRKGMVLKVVGPALFPNQKDLGIKEKPKEKMTGTPSSTPGKIVPLSPTVLRTPTQTPTAIAPPKNLAVVKRPKVNQAFAAGEKLKFEIRALGVLGGYASLEVHKAVTIADRPCYPLTARANSVFPLEAVYAVKDVQTSYFDAVDFLSWRFENDVHEGGYKARNREDYDQVKHKAVRRHNDEEPLEIDIQPFSQDIISCFYYFRLLPVEVGKTYVIPTQSTGQNYKLYIQVLKKERITVSAGTFDCLKVKPLVQSDTVFRNNRDIDLWVTDDDRHFPVKIKSGIVIGSIDVDLLEATLPPLKGD